MLMAQWTLETISVTMPQLGNRRRIVRILLPPRYHCLTDRRYALLIMQDGHNLFDPRTSAFGMHWRIRETMESLTAAGRNPRIIIAGVDCNHDRGGLARLDEYSPWVNDAIDQDISRARGIDTKAGGEGAAYLAFIADTLLPLLRHRYRTIASPSATGIAGSSMGALFSLYALYSRPDLFSVCGAFSPALWFAKNQIADFVRSRFRPDLAVYLDIGTRETSDADKPDFPERYLRDTLELRDELLELGIPADNLKFVLEEGADHSEHSWARRFPGFLLWALDRFGMVDEGAPHN